MLHARIIIPPPPVVKPFCAAAVDLARKMGYNPCMMKEHSDFIFDLYGTLADIRTDEASPALWRKAALYFGAHGAAYLPAELKERYLALCDAEQRKSPDPYYEIELSEVFASLYRDKGVEPDGRLVAETALFFRLASVKKLRLYPWTLPLIGRLRAAGKGIYLLSNAQSCFTLPELRALGLADAFDGIAISSDLGLKKPHPGIMRALLEENGLDPASCVMTGNDRTTDIAIAKAFGMDSVFIRTESSGGPVPGLEANIETDELSLKKDPALLEIWS